MSFILMDDCHVSHIGKMFSVDDPHDLIHICERTIFFLRCHSLLSGYCHTINDLIVSDCSFLIEFHRFWLIITVGLKKVSNLLGIFSSCNPQLVSTNGLGAPSICYISRMS